MFGFLLLIVIQQNLRVILTTLLGLYWQEYHMNCISSMERERLRRHLHYWRGVVESKALVFRVFLRY